MRLLVFHLPPDSFGALAVYCSLLLARRYGNIKPSEYMERGTSSSCWHFDGYFTPQAGAFHHTAHSPGVALRALALLLKDLG